MDADLYTDLVNDNRCRILLFVMDGLGGLPSPAGGKTALAGAQTPNLDKLAARASCGLLHSIARGVTPGSGPAHLSLFGYDPVQYHIGRGALSAAGVDFPLQQGDVAARVNFATMDPSGKITDRRAGRISSEEGRRLCEKISAGLMLEDAAVFIRPEREHRAVCILRSPGLSDQIHDTDPQKTGVPMPPPSPRNDSPEARKTARLLEDMYLRVGIILKDEAKANTVLLRGFAHPPTLPSYQERYRLRAAAIAVYPMYRGLARIAGMDVLETGPEVRDQVEVLNAHLDRYDFFYVHVKKTDSYGEDGAWEKKKAVIESVDRAFADILKMPWDVIAVTGDHSTPSAMKTHSWHPVPVLLHAKHCLSDPVEAFHELACAHGYLGHMHGTELMPLLLAHAGKLNKYGA